MQGSTALLVVAMMLINIGLYVTRMGMHTKTVSPYKGLLNKVGLRHILPVLGLTLLPWWRLNMVQVRSNPLVCSIHMLLLLLWGNTICV